MTDSTIVCEIQKSRGVRESLSSSSFGGSSDAFDGSGFPIQQVGGNGELACLRLQDELRCVAPLRHGTASDERG